MQTDRKADYRGVQIAGSESGSVERNVSETLARHERRNGSLIAVANIRYNKRRAAREPDTRVGSLRADRRTSARRAAAFCGFDK